MRHRFDSWAIVLAGGDGMRLQSLTRNQNGTVIPKQFCSLRGEASLLASALTRGKAVAPQKQLSVVVSAQHRAWWAAGVLDGLLDSNIFVQPQNRGTAHGILFPLVKIAARDPNATVVLLPSDHYFADEQTIAASLRRAAAIARGNPESIHLLGIEPDEPDPELGYILPSLSPRRRSLRVTRFVEKPKISQARRLIKMGALWNVFIMAASVRSLLGLYGSSYDATIAAMSRCDGSALDDLYRTLPMIDFSRNILEENVTKLRVLQVPRCGWTNLGTPARIGFMAERFRAEPQALEATTNASATLSLVAQYVRGLGHAMVDEVSFARAAKF